MPGWGGIGEEITRLVLPNAVAGNVARDPLHGGALQHHVEHRGRRSLCGPASIRSACRSPPTRPKR